MMQWLPQSISTFGPKIDHVIYTIYVIVGVWFLLVEGILFYFLFRYRKKAGVKAGFVPGNTLASLAWVLVPAVIILGFDIGIDLVQGPVWHEIKIDRPANPDQRIKISGRQFAWEFTLPGKDGQLGTADDIESLNILAVPVGKKVQFALRSKDVIHSFWVPSLRLKQDAVPGREILGWFDTNKEGTYIIGCAELCGSGHGMMRGELRVLNEADYQKWLSENSPEVPAQEVSQNAQ